MEGKVIVFHHNHPYMTSKQLSESLDVGVRQAQHYVEWVRKGIEKGRYSPYVILGRQYNFYAVLDAIKWRDAFDDKNLMNKIPPFDPVKLAELCGYCKQVTIFKEATL